jgi:hypothetical protein
MIAPLAHDDAPLAVDQNAVGPVELPVSTAFAADGSYVAAVAVAQHLHPIIQRVSYDDVACTVKRDAVGQFNRPEPVCENAFLKHAQRLLQSARQENAKIGVAAVSHLSSTLESAFKVTNLS